MSMVEYLNFYRHDIVNGAGAPYMKRWILKMQGGGWRLHKILRSDDDRALHDHPFDFTSLLLRGAYIEHVPADPLNPWGPTVERRFQAGQVNRCVAARPHRLELREGPVWTLVRCAPKRRDWGFYAPAGWVRWDLYEKIIGVDFNHRGT
jgi:hypothetical protein